MGGVQTAMLRKQFRRCLSRSAFDKMTQTGLKVNYDTSYFMPDEKGMAAIFEDRRNGYGRGDPNALILIISIYVDGKPVADVENRFSTSALIR